MKHYIVFGLPQYGSHTCHSWSSSCAPEVSATRIRFFAMSWTHQSQKDQLLVRKSGFCVRPTGLELPRNTLPFLCPWRPVWRPFILRIAQTLAPRKGWRPISESLRFFWIFEGSITCRCAFSWATRPVWGSARCRSDRHIREPESTIRMRSPTHETFRSGSPFPRHEIRQQRNQLAKKYYHCGVRVVIASVLPLRIIRRFTGLTLHPLLEVSPAFIAKRCGSSLSEYHSRSKRY